MKNTKYAVITVFTTYGKLVVGDKEKKATLPKKKKGLKLTLILKNLEMRGCGSRFESKKR